MFLIAKVVNKMFEAWDVEDGMGGSSLKKECFRDLDIILLWNIVSIRFR